MQSCLQVFVMCSIGQSGLVKPKRKKQDRSVDAPISSFVGFIVLCDVLGKFVILRCDVTYLSRYSRGS